MDRNTTLFTYLCTLYTVEPIGNDLTSLILRRLAELTGEYTARFQQLIADAGA